MIALGLSEPKAAELARKHDATFLLDRIDYVTHQVESSRKGSFKNPPVTSSASLRANRRFRTTSRQVADARP